MRKSGLTWFMVLALAAVGCDDDGGSGGADAAAGSGGTSVDGGGGTGGGGVGGTGGTVQDAGANTNAAATLMVTTAFPDAGAMSGGLVTFNQSGNAVTVIINLVGMPPGDHGVHVHMGGSCADTTADGGVVVAGAAGPHWNPTSMKHGVLGSDGGMHHAGDLGNVTVNAGGMGNKVIKTEEWDVADVLGKAVVVHAGRDDLMTDPTGNSGGRIACGVVKAK